MEHSYYKDKLSAYFDSALEVQEMELLRRHLEACAECRELLEKLSSLSQKIEELSGLDENEYFDRLAAKIDNRIARTDSKIVKLPRKEFLGIGFGWKISATAASILLIATVSYYQWQDHESSLDKILELPAKPAQPIRVLGGSEVQSESVLEIAPEEKEADSAVTSEIKEIEKDVPAAVGESKAMREPRMIVKPKELKRMTKFETSRQSIIKTAPVLIQEQENEDEPKEDIAKEIIADFQIINLPVTRLAAQTEREEVLAPSVQDWRDKRDSLLQVEAEVYKAASGGRLKSVALSDSDKFGYNSKDSALALAWYNIGLLTSDSTEKKEAIEFLEKHSKRSRADSAVIREYLENLKD